MQRWSTNLHSFFMDRNYSLQTKNLMWTPITGKITGSIVLATILIPVIFVFFFSVILIKLFRRVKLHCGKLQGNIYLVCPWAEMVIEFVKAFCLGYSHLASSFVQNLKIMISNLEFYLLVKYL